MNKTRRSTSNYRATVGLLLGTAVGLAYGAVSQSINYLAMPGIQFANPPFGLLGNILLSTLLGALMGWSAGLPENGFTGVLASSMIGALAISIATLFSGAEGGDAATNRLVGLALIFIPLVGMIALLMIVFRWIVQRENNAHREVLAGQDQWRPARLLLPVVLVLAALATGLSGLLPELGRSAVPRMQALVQEGLHAPNSAALPAPLQPPDVDGFLQNALGDYTLQWDQDEGNRYAIPRPGGDVRPSLVVARFENGYLLACLFTGPDRQPECRGIWED